MLASPVENSRISCWLLKSLQLQDCDCKENWVFNIRLFAHRIVGVWLILASFQLLLEKTREESGFTGVHSHDRLAEGLYEFQVCHHVWWRHSDVDHQNLFISYKDVTHFMSSVDLVTLLKFSVALLSSTSQKSCNEKPAGKLTEPVRVEELWGQLYLGTFSLLFWLERAQNAMNLSASRKLFP